MQPVDLGSGRRWTLPTPLAPELKLVPGRDRRDLEQGALAVRVDVGELAGLVLPGHVESSVLDPVVEPRAAEDELPQPVDERLAADQREVLPVADEVEAEPAAGLGDPAVGRQLDEVGSLLLVQVVSPDKAQLH